MSWLIVASLFAAASLVPVYAQMLPTGRCATIGYSTSCCPRGANCQAGDCSCSHDCYVFNECCPDVGCPENPRTCADIGINECCMDTSIGACDVRTVGHPDYCSCNVSCHARGDCCTDASTFCVPRTCADAGMSAGCCQWSTTSCYVPGDNCYCDSYCHVFGDCCGDIQPQCSRTVTSQSWRSRQSRLQSALEQELTASQVQDYYRGRGVNIENDNSDYTHHRMALAARTQRVRANAREFRRGRARVAVRPPGPPPYNY